MGWTHRPIERILEFADGKYWTVKEIDRTSPNVIPSEIFSPRVKGVVDYLRSQKLTESSCGISFVGDYTDFPDPHQAEILLYSVEHNENGVLRCHDRAIIAITKGFIIDTNYSVRYPLLVDLCRELKGKYVNEFGTIGEFTPVAD